MLYRGESRQTLPLIGEWRRFDAADVQPGLFWCEDLREARCQLMAVGESPNSDSDWPWAGADPGRRMGEAALKTTQGIQNNPGD